MPQRKSTDQENPTPTLRRSPRFTAAAATEISAIKVHKKHIEVSKNPKKSSTGVRRSGRLSIGTPQNNGEKKRVTRGSTHGENSVEKRKGVITRSGKAACVERPVVSSEVAGCGEDDDNGSGKKQAGLKRKRTQGVEENGVANGWTNEQETALQTAYFAAKATPNFWKKVARMVPGKSAKDCFDKIHSDFMTPPQPQPRSRIKKMNTTSLSPCATKLLQSTKKNTNKRRYSKPKSHLSRKAVRELLQKQTDIDRDKEADFFSALESSADPTAKALCPNTIFLTPECNKEGLNYLRKCLERSSSTHKKHRSRLSGSSVATLTSPPVLKPIKNKALHERYVDQLHCREAKRKAAASRTAKVQQNKNDHQNENVIKVDVIKAAKNALISEARDAINQFQNLQNSFNDDDDDDYDENLNGDDDEDAR
ncbi:putative U-box domain-containing protein 44-like [Capsicum annuum]|uniref:uncharacterized protein LOC107840210 n=1 Tax=Capsicum annuum TaxID=4072 RepID=UPI0007BF2AA5|nr:uncharacterized protein LOC107840210 [Capsicum annuum]KAF3647987.1 putative U-box domain-containing protein 44-like [Capsicum annuum]